MSLNNLKYKIKLAFWLWMLDVVDVTSAWSYSEALMSVRDELSLKSDPKELANLEKNYLPYY